MKSYIRLDLLFLGGNKKKKIRNQLHEHYIHKYIQLNFLICFKELKLSSQMAIFKENQEICTCRNVYQHIVFIQAIKYGGPT